MINEQNDIDKIYLYPRNLSEPKYEYFIKKREYAGIKHLNDTNAFIKYSNTTDDVYEIINDYNPIRKRKRIIVFDMISDIMTNKKIQAIIKELFIRCRNLIFHLLYHTVLSFCSKRCKIKFNTLFDYENKQQNRIKKYCN